MNPYRIEGPALISFSGGRTSGYMLWHILNAYDGKLPEDVHVTFANTGKEREETLRFVHNCSSHWGVRVRWLEWRSRLKRVPVEERFEEVGFNSAARQGEPFRALCKSKKSTPNQERRWCTEHLKVQVMHDFMLSLGLPPSSYREAVGQRADEQHRYFKMLDRNGHGRQCVAPLMKAGVTKPVVLDWWRQQPFDLGLDAPDGNCTLCFLKGKKNLKWLIRRDPGEAIWWDRVEQECGGTFSSRYAIADLVHDVASQPLLNLEDDQPEEFDAECGLWCASE